nr:transposase (putative), gypsy type [Tanacetum cinerariifolium]
MGRDTVQLETAVNTISYEYLLEFTSEYDIPEALHPALPGPEDRVVDFPEGKIGVYTSKSPGKNTPQCYTKPLDSLKNWNNRFFWVDESVFPTVVDWRSNAPKDGMPAAGTYSVEAVRALDTHRNPIKKQPEMLLCLVGLSRRYYLGDEVYPTFLHDNDRGGIVGVPPTIERSLLDFSIEARASDQGTAASEVSPSREVPAAAAPEPSHVGVAAADPPAATESRKRSRDGTDANAPPSHCEEIMLILGPPEALIGERASLPYSWAWLLLLPCLKMHLQASSLGVVAVEDSESENASSPTEVGSLGGVYRPEWVSPMVAYLTPLRPVKTCSSSGPGVTAAPQVRTKGQAAEEIRGPGGSPG